MLTVAIALIFLSLLGVSTGRRNDWTKPCVSGVCFYDLPDDGGSASSGTLKVWGPTGAISDITPAAGWEIIDCNPNELSQDIRLVCAGGANCDHLYSSVGAVGKVVRLPESCGANAFAVVSRAWVPSDQSIPQNVEKRIIKRDGSRPQVKALRIDTNYGNIDPKKVGTINFAIRGANIPGADNITAPFPGSSRSQRGFFRDFISSLNDVDIDKSTDLPPFDIDKSFNLIDESLSCPSLTGNLKIDARAKAHAVATLGVVAQGTIIPPKVTDFSLSAALTADLNGALNITGGLTGVIDSGKIKLFETAIPGLSFPGILTVGPSFRVDAQALANLDASANLDVGINYHVEKAKLVFPPNSKAAQANGGAFSVADTPLKLAVTPSVKATGNIEAHIIPSLNLGLNALGGAADVSVFLNLDGSVTLKLDLDGSTEVPIVNTGRERTGVAARNQEDLVVRGPASNMPFKRQNSPGFGGCVEVLAGLDVNAGATGKFFGLFDQSKTISLFNKDFDLLKKCFGVASRRALGHISRSLNGYKRRSTPTILAKRLKCPILPDVSTVIDEIIPVKSIKAL